jgi:tRNA(Ile)-lysidine synthetase-like protein
MDISVRPGHYVIAVSGGVDSMTLLHMLRQQPGVRLTVAHFDHGIRPDSAEDRRHVEAVAWMHGLPFVYNQANLGSNASEAAARQARYQFLHRVKQATGARAIITAHHQDDALETAALNISRGTGRKGLSSLGEHHDLHRPLLLIPKQEIIAYAQQQGLEWREDSTNLDQKYLRNYLRHTIMPKMNDKQRQQLLRMIKKQHEVNREIDMRLATILHRQSEGGKIDRRWFNTLPHDVAKEVMAAWLRAHNITDFDSKKLERLVVKAKTMSGGKSLDVVKNTKVHITPAHLALNL